MEKLAVVRTVFHPKGVSNRPDFFIDGKFLYCHSNAPLEAIGIPALKIIDNKIYKYDFKKRSIVGDPIYFIFNDAIIPIDDFLKQPLYKIIYQ